MASATEATCKEKTKRIALGLAISGATLGPGMTRSCREIAAFCGCTWNAIWLIELRALEKIRKNPRKARLLRELLEEFR